MKIFTRLYLNTYDPSLPVALTVPHTLVVPVAPAPIMNLNLNLNPPNSHIKTRKPNSIPPMQLLKLGNTWSTRPLKIQSPTVFTKSNFFITNVNTALSTFDDALTTKHPIRRKTNLG